MAEERDRTGDPMKDAPPPPRSSSKFAWGCIALLIIFGFILAFVFGGPMEFGS